MLKILNHRIIFFLLISYIFFTCVQLPLYLEWELFKLYNLNWTIDLFVDKYSSIFSLIVNLITLCIFLYSLRYMRKEKDKNIFFYVLFFFSLRMQILIFSFSFSRILLGWDGLGITSFYLIIFYHNVKRLHGRMVTVLTNRLGDCFVIISICLSLENLRFNVFTLKHITLWTCFFLLLASLTKRAQLPFSFWLPKAMAAPTPVSSLVHSSTLVTAGVYILFRFNHVFNFLYKTFLLILSFRTLIIGGFMAIKRFDLKEIVAFSTLRQVGLIIFFMSLRLKEVAIFHLLTHALFKSVLFICRGYLIHHYHTQDIRKISLDSVRPVLKLSIIISLSSIRGLPFLSGFYSKDLIVDSLSSYNSRFKLLLMSIIIVSTSFIYTLRLINFMLIIKTNNKKTWKWNKMLLSIYFLIIGSIFIGSSIQWTIMCNFFFHTRNIKYAIIIILYFVIVINFFTNFKINLYKNLKNFNYLVLKNLIWFNKNFFILDSGWLNWIYRHVINLDNKLSLIITKLWIIFILPLRILVIIILH